MRARWNRNLPEQCPRYIKKPRNINMAAAIAKKPVFALLHLEAAVFIVSKHFWAQTIRFDKPKMIPNNLQKSNFNMAASSRP